MAEVLTREGVADLLHRRRAVKTGGSYPFKYHEDHPDAPIPRVYVSIRGKPKGSLTDKDLERIGHHMASIYRRKNPPPFDLVAPLPDAGTPLGEAFRDVWPTPVGLLRLKKVTEGDRRRIIPSTDDPYRRGMRVVIADDLCSTSATKVEGILAVRELGLVIVGGIMAASYRLGGEEEILQRFGVKLDYSFTVSWLLGYYLTKKWVTKAHKAQAEQSMRRLSNYMADHRAS